MNRIERGLKRLKSKKGFTLVEMLAGTYLLILLVTLAGTMIIASGNIFVENAFLSRGQSVGNTLFSFIENRLLYSSSLKLGTTPEGGTPAGYAEEICFSSSGQNVILTRYSPALSPTSEVIYGSDDLDGLYITVNADCTALTLTEPYIILTITLHEGSVDGKASYTRTGTVPLLNFKSGNETNFSTAELGNGAADTYIYCTYNV